MKIALVNPWIYDVAAYDFWIKPLGLLHLGYILANSGYEVKLIDCLDRFHPAVQGRVRLKEKEILTGTGKFPSETIPKPPPYRNIPRHYKRYGITPESFLQELKAFYPFEICFLTCCMTYWYPGLFEAIKIIKEHFPKATVIIGGLYAKLCSRHAESNSGADHIYKGGESLYDFFMSFGLSINPKFKSFDRFFPIKYELYSRLTSAGILTSNGCPFSCFYCFRSWIRDKFVQFDVELVAEQIEQLYRDLGVKNLAFYDDALLVNPENHIKPLLKILLDKNIKISLHSPNGLHPSFIDKELAILMKKANFFEPRLSLESIFPDKYDQPKIKITPEKFLESVQNLVNAGYERKELIVYLISGLPGQTASEVEKSIEFVKKMGLRISLSSFSPVPGTKAYELFKENVHLNLDEEPLYHNNSITPYISPFLNLEEFNKLQILAK